MLDFSKARIRRDGTWVVDLTEKQFFHLALDSLLGHYARDVGLPEWDASLHLHVDVRLTFDRQDELRVRVYIEDPQLPEVS